MPRIHCHYVDCTFLEKGYCRAPSVEFDPDEGCLTYAQFDDVPAEEEWAEEETDELWENEAETPEGEELDSDWTGEEEA